MSQEGTPILSISSSLKGPKYTSLNSWNFLLFLCANLYEWSRNVFSYNYGAVQIFLLAWEVVSMLLLKNDLMTLFPMWGPKSKMTNQQHMSLHSLLCKPKVDIINKSDHSFPLNLDMVSESFPKKTFRHLSLIKPGAIFFVSSLSVYLLVELPWIPSHFREPSPFLKIPFYFSHTHHHSSIPCLLKDPNVWSLPDITIYCCVTWSKYTNSLCCCLLTCKLEIVKVATPQS